MAIMIPNQIPNKSSEAEKNIFYRLKKLPDNYVVMYSLGLSNHIRKIQGEIDFIVICEKGILCLEVKGGNVSREEGQWFVEAKTGHKNSIENPFRQVSDNMYSLRRYLMAVMKDDTILYTCGVIMPDISFQVNGPEIDNNILIDIEKLNKYDMQELIDNIFNYYSEKYNNIYLKMKQKLTSSMVEKITIILRGNLGYAKRLSIELDEIQNCLLELTQEQKNILDTMRENNRVIINGTGGTGKTVLLYEQTLRLSALGYKVIFICYNKSLSQHLNNILDTEDVKIKENIKISTLHSYMYEQLKMVQEEYITENTQEYFNEILPNDFLKIDNEKYDIVLIDEAQDILNKVYGKCIEKIIKGGIVNGIWYMSVDEKQNLYDNVELNESLDIIKQEVRPSVTVLTKNCRNTKQISLFNVKLTNIEQSVNEMVNGREVQEIEYVYNNNQQESVINIIKDLRKQGIRNSDIVILSKWSYETSVFKGKNFLKDISQYIEIVGEYNKNVGDYVKFSTIRKFKGLESKVVILCDVDDINSEKSRNLNYVAVSRAKTLLYVLHKSGVYLQAVNNNVEDILNKLFIS